MTKFSINLLMGNFPHKKAGDMCCLGRNIFLFYKNIILSKQLGDTLHFQLPLGGKCAEV